MSELCASGLYLPDFTADQKRIQTGSRYIGSGQIRIRIWIQWPVIVVSNDIWR